MRKCRVSGPVILARPERNSPTSRLFKTMKLTRFFITLSLIASMTTPLKSSAQRSQKAGGASVDVIVRGGKVVTMDKDRRVIDDGSVAIKGGRIVAVGSLAEIDKNYSARETIDARGHVVIPGLINGHTHVPMTLFRGLADDLDLQEWLTKYIFPAEAKKVTEEI